MAGTGVAAYSGDGGRATQAELAYPFGLGITPENLIYIADAGCQCWDPKTHGHARLLRLSDGVITTVAG